MSYMNTAFLFPGQGAQATGMGVSLAECSKAARGVFDSAGAIMGEDVAALVQQPKDVLSQTKYAQPVTFIVAVAAMRALMERGVRPSFAAGFSLGEYTALVCAGVLGFEDALSLVQKRGEFMAKCPGAMLAVMGLGADELKAHLDEAGGKLWPVNYNSPGQIVVAGEARAIESLEAALKAKRVRRVRLAVSGGFHSPLMRPAADELRRELAKVSFSKPQIPVILNMTGREADDNADFAAILEAHCVSPVLWEQSVRRLGELGAARMIECGHGGVLAGLVKRTLPDMPVLSVQDAQSLEGAC